MEAPLTSLPQLVQEAARRVPARLAVACGEDTHTLQSVADAMARGLVNPVVYGRRRAVEEACAACGIDPSALTVEDTPTDIDCVKRAVGAVASGEADVLMKGLVSSDKYLRGILDREAGLFPEGSLLSHVAVMEIPGLRRLVCVSDVAVIPAPDFREKLRILGYLAGVARSLGMERPRIACIAPSEQVLPRVVSSTDSAVIAKMAARGQLGDVIVDGPLSLDVALWPEVAAEKKVQGSDVAGKAQCLLFPNIESGNVFFKCVTHIGGGHVAAVVTGTKAPCVLTSRGDTPLSKLYSIALACLMRK